MAATEESQTVFDTAKHQSLRKRLQRRWQVARWWKRLIFVLTALLLLALFVVVVLILVVVIRAAVYSTPAFQHPELFAEPAIGLEDDKQRLRAENLAGAIRVMTVSNDISEGEDPNKNKFVLLHHHLLKCFPLVHSSPFVTREVINKNSLLYTVQGSDPGDALPYLLAAHMDVVPADPAKWEVPPFSGEIINDTFVYGRGAFDDKGGVMGIMEALEYMLEKGEQPRRTFFVAYGHDEEVSGKDGADMIGKALRARGVDQLDFVLDEGLFVTRGLVPGASQDVAIVGVSEKGFLTLELEVEMTAVHSSLPPWETSIGVLSAAMAKIEKNKLPSQLGRGPEKYTLEYVAPYSSFGMRMIYTNLWLFSDIVSSVMQTDQLLNAVVRTTTALTIINGGFKDNVVPAKCMGVVNHRVHPAQTIDEVIEFDRKVVDDPRVQFRVRDSRQAHPVAPFGPGDVHYHMVAASITQTFPDTAVVPGLLVANTDTWWYLNFTENVFRFFPTILDPVDTLRFHGDNERISIDIYALAVDFYYRIIQNADKIYDYATPQH